MCAICGHSSLCLKHRHHIRLNNEQIFYNWEGLFDSFKRKRIFTFTLWQSVNPQDFKKYMSILSLSHKRNILISLLRELVLKEEIQSKSVECNVWIQTLLILKWCADSQSNFRGIRCKIKQETVWIREACSRPCNCVESPLSKRNWSVNDQNYEVQIFSDRVSSDR